MSTYNFSDFESIDQEVVNGKERRSKGAENMLSFGVPFLDRSLSGIRPTDVVLIGGRSGQGKTELATHIALANAKAGKKVYLYALEHERGEVSDRILYKLLAEKYFNSKERDNCVDVSFENWDNGKLDNIFESFYDECVEEVKQFKNLKVRYRDNNFDLKELEKSLLSNRLDADLSIIDHLHYIDTEDENENKAYKDIVKYIRSAALEFNKPIVLLAHVRKSDIRNYKLCPDQEDFHGSSDIYKIATKIITVAPAFDIKPPTDHPWLWPTYLRICKHRKNGAKTKYIGVSTYDSRKNEYNNEFILGEFKKGDTEFEELQIYDYPRWAR